MAGHIPFRFVDSALVASRSLWLATTRPDGRAHVAPVWFLWDGSSIYFNTGIATQKHRNLEHHAWAIAHLGDGDDVVIAEGLVSHVEDSDELAGVDRKYREKYVDPHSGATAGYPETPDSVPFRLDPDRIMAWEYGVVVTRTDFAPDARGGWRQSAPRII